MKLVDFTNPLLEILLPADLVWVDEFKWSPIQREDSYGVGGALIVQQGLKLAGRPITLQNPDQEMAWVYRDTLLSLYAWSADPDKKMVLHLEKPTDARTFVVTFGPSNPVDAQPVKSWKDHTTTEPYTATIRLIVVA